MVSFRDLREVACDKDCSICAQSSLNCDGNYQEWKREKKLCANVHVFKPYFDVTLGKVVESKKEIREYCAKNDCVYAGDKELTQQCEQNKRENEIKREQAFEKNLTESLLRVC